MAGQASVIVAHGLWLPGAETWLLRRRLAAHGFRPFSFRYRTVADGLAANAEALARFAAAVPGDTVHFVGYSLGGVVCASLLATRPPTRTGRLVCVGAPLAGSASARVLMRSRVGRRLLGRSAAELNERGGIGPWRSPIELGSLAGRVSFGLGLLLGGLDGANDGTVAIEETRIEGVTDTLTRDASHTWLLFSRRVADDVARFLEHGRF